MSGLSDDAGGCRPAAAIRTRYAPAVERALSILEAVASANHGFTFRSRNWQAG